MKAAAQDGMLSQTMPVRLNHTIVSARAPAVSAAFLADVLGLPEPARFGPFHVVEVDNGVALDFMQADGAIAPQHYAFLVSEEAFDEIFARHRERGVPWWADPGHREPGRINRADGGRGL